MELRSDEQLLDLFLTGQDPVAFSVLMDRHTPVVRAACAIWLRTSADIDDAVQATFIVFLRRADTIRNRGSLGRWLYRVGIQISRRMALKRHPTGTLPDNLPARPQPIEDRWLLELIQQEIAQLPEKYRVAVELCYADGLTVGEAATRLDCPRGTVLTRLAYARTVLRKRLLARKITGSTGLQLGTGLLKAVLVLTLMSWDRIAMTVKQTLYWALIGFVTLGCQPSIKPPSVIDMPSKVVSFDLVVKYDGKPLRLGNITLVPDGSGTHPFRPSGLIENGKADVYTASTRGAAPGTYKVAVNVDFSTGLPPGFKGPLPKIPSRYSDPERSNLRLTILDSDNQELSLNLVP